MNRMNLSLVSVIVSVLIIAAVAAVIFTGIGEFRKTSEQKRITQVEDIVRESVAQCYALEGAYPDDLKYLQDNYGLQLDTVRYTYHYDKFASNIMPDVRVFERKVATP